MTLDRLLRIVSLRFRSLARRDDVERELDDEMRDHIERETAANVRRGMSLSAARTMALREFGGIEYHKEEARDQRGTRWLDELTADVRFAFRSLRNSPTFAAVVVLTLALGIGANTAIFSVVRGVLLKPLPHRDGDRLLYLRHSASGPGQSNLTFSVPEVRDLRSGVPSLSGIAEYSSWMVMQQTKDGPVRINVGLVTGNFFEVMGLSPILGRLTQPSDDGRAAHRVAVLAYEYWLKQFGGDSSVVGTQVSLDRQPVTIIGVLQPAPFFPNRVEMLLNLVNSEHHLGASMQDNRLHRMTEVVARMKPGASIEQVRTEVATVYKRVTREFSEAYPAAGGYNVAVIPFKTVMGEKARLTLWLLMASAAFVLIVSAANVANLTLMRGVRREHELVVRTALGAGAGRLRRLLLVENLLLTLFGGSLGILIANAGVRLLKAFAERYSTRTADIRLDGIVFAFTLAVSVGVALVLSFLASLPREARIGSRIMTGAQRSSGGLGRRRMQRSLVVVQIAVTVVLLAGAGLLTRTMIELSHVDTGLTSEDVLTMRVTQLTRAERSDSTLAAVARQRFEEMRDQIAALPGVTAVGIGGTLPLRSEDFFYLVQAEGKPPAAGETLTRVEFRGADQNFFRAAGVPLIKGRMFSTSDKDVVIVNKTFVDRFFPNEDPIGKRIAWKADWQPDSLHWGLTIVGVVGNTRDGRLDAPPRMVAFELMSRMPTQTAGFVIRASGSTPGLPAQATRIVRRVAPLALVDNVMTVAQFRQQSVSPQRLNAGLITSFGALAVIIAAVGIGGVLAFAVSARTNEIGIRMSLGADSGRVQRMVLREGGTLVAIGLVLGVVGAYLSAGVIRGLLFGVTPNDPMTYIAVGVTMATIGVIACWIPALRAARIDPAIAMRAS